MAEPLRDEALVGAFSRGDESAFDAIVSRYGSDVARLANSLLGWPGEVEDVAQDVFLAAYMNLERFRGQSSLQTWLFTITVNECRSLARRRLMQQRVLTAFRQHSKTSIETQRSDGGLSDAVLRALRRLPVRYREPIVLYYLEELSVEQIGTVLGLSVNTVHVRLGRARHRLKEQLANWDSIHE